MMTIESLWPSPAAGLFLPWIIHGLLSLFLGMKLFFNPLKGSASLLSKKEEREEKEKRIKRLFNFTHGLTMFIALVNIGLYLKNSLFYPLNPLKTASPAGKFLLGRWIVFHDYLFEWVFQFDQLSLIYSSLAVIISGIIVHFSFQFLHRDPRFERFFFLIQILCFAVCTIALSGNYDVLFIGWELAGVASVLLISFFQENIRSAQNSFRALIYYRFCDMCLLLALVGLHHHPEKYRSMIGLLFILASLAKSGQFPFLNFLPRAMEGPTTSSAIFYGALSIHLGPFLLLRSFEFWGPSHTLKIFVFCLGLLTALMSTLIGRTRSDAKTLLAYAAMGQVGLIYIELALGFFTLAKIHIIAHAGLRVWQFLRTSSLLQDFLDNPEIFKNIRQQRKVSPEAWLPKKLNRWLYLHSVQGMYMDSIHFNLLAKPFLKFCRQWKNMGLGLPDFLKILGIYALLTLFVLGVFVFLQGTFPKGVFPNYEFIGMGFLLFFAFLRTGQALTQNSFSKALWATFHSQIALIFIGPLVSPHRELGAVGSLLMGLNLVLSFFPLFLIQKDLHRRYQKDQLDIYWGLSSQEKVYEKIFLSAGLLSLGIPGSLAFIGEDLVFHALLDFSPWATTLHILLLGLNGIAFYRIYHFIFMGRNQTSLALAVGAKDLSHLGLSETLTRPKVLALPLALIFLLALYPQVILVFLGHPLFPQ